MYPISHGSVPSQVAQKPADPKEICYAHLSSFSTKHEPETIELALDAAKTIAKESTRCLALLDIAHHLMKMGTSNAKMTAQALSVIELISNKTNSAEAYFELAKEAVKSSPDFACDLANKALTQIHLIPEEPLKSQLLWKISKLFAKIPGQLENALKIAESIFDKETRSYALVDLAKLGYNQFPKSKIFAIASNALTSAKEVPDENVRPFVIQTVSVLLLKMNATFAALDATDAALAAADKIISPRTKEVFLSNISSQFKRLGDSTSALKVQQLIREARSAGASTPISMPKRAGEA